MTTPVAMATNRYYSQAKLAAAQHVLKCLRHYYIIHNFSLHQLLLPVRTYSKTVNKFIVIKSNTKNFDKDQLKNSKKNRAINFNSLQSYVRAK